MDNTLLTSSTDDNESSSSKWAILQMLIKDEVSLNTSVNLRYKQTISQFSSKCYKIYKKKIKIHDITQHNRRIIEKINTTYNYTPSKINILSIENNLSKSDEITFFLTEFRKNNYLMLNLINSLSYDEHNTIVPFLCHFFYENFYSESTEQIEMLYIIYLLLEQEVDKLHTPSVSSFLDESFIGKFLREIGNRYEVKCYLNRILKDLIVGLENDYNEYIELDIEEWRDKELKRKKKKDIKKTKSNPAYATGNVNASFVKQTNKNNMYKKQMSSTIDYSRTALNTDDGGHMNINNLSMNDSSLSIGNNIPVVMTNERIEEEISKSFRYCYIKSKLETCEGYQRTFLLEHIKRLDHNDTNIYSNDHFNNALSALPPNTRHKYLSDYQTSYELITKFLMTLFSNITNDISIMPYSIKCICKIIKVLISNKFPQMTSISLNSFISQFLFDKLMIPILLNPDTNDFGSSTIISMATRQNLINIAMVLHKFTHGQFFSSASSTNESCYTIFNSFLYNHLQSFNHLLNTITSSITLPMKLDKLSKEFYCKDNATLPFKLNNALRKHEEINYVYFNENQYDFMEHQSICFEYKQLNILLKKIKTSVLDMHPEMKKVHKQIMEFWQVIFEQMCPLNNSSGKRNFYVIIKDSYKEDVKRLLFTKEKPISLGANNANTDYTKEMKYCVGYLLSQMEMQNNSDWVSDKPSTINTFNLIHEYNEYYDEINTNEKVPLSWYSLYVVTNLMKMPMNYKEKDYELLYDEIYKETKKKIDLLKKINDFLTIQITSKFSCLDHNIHIAKKELQTIRAAKLNSEIVRFIEMNTMSMCLMNSSETKELSVTNCNKCPHSQMNDKRKEKDKETSNDMIEFHCSNIKEFIDLFSHVSSIQDDLVNETNHSKANEALNAYLEHIKEIITPLSSSFININSCCSQSVFTFESCKLPKADPFSSKSNNKGKPDENIIEIVLNELGNYILKKSFATLYPITPIKEDIAFYEACCKIQWIDPIKNLAILPAVHNKVLFDMIKEYIHRLEIEKTPQDKLKALTKEVGLITSLIKFTTKEKIVPAEMLIPIIIYSIIIAKPKRMISSYRWIKMFMNENTTLGDMGYNATHIEMGINYVLTVNHHMVKVLEDEFNHNCLKSLKEQSH